MTKHTPGPWSLWTGCSWRRFGSDATGELVCTPTVAHDGQPDLLFPNGGQDGPDARLIAAAPELLAACKAAEDLHRIGLFSAAPGQISRVNEIRRAAIAKAEGGQSEK